MAIIGRPPSWKESILFTISTEGEIRSLKSPLPFPHRPSASASPGRVCTSPLKKRFPQEDLRRANFEVRPLKSQRSSSRAPSSFSLNSTPNASSFPATLNTSIDFGPADRPVTSDSRTCNHRERSVTRTAIGIARSAYVQLGLQRRYWDPPLHPQRHELVTPQCLSGSDSISKATALTDINIIGDPIRMCTPDFDVGPRGLKVGACLFLNLPYGANDACGLQVRMKDGSPADQPRFLLEVAAVVVDTGTGKKRWRLCTQHDVTGMVNGMARKRLASEGASSPSVQNSGPTSEADSPSSFSSPDSNVFDWTAFTEEEFHQSHSRTPQATRNDNSRPVSSTPSRCSGSYRLSGSTLVPSVRSSARSTLIATPHVSHNAARPPPPPPPAPSPPPTTLFATIPPADIRAFLHLAHSTKHAHATSFFVLVPLRRHPAVANHSRTRGSTVPNTRPSAPAPGTHTAVPALLDHVVEFVSLDLAERPGVLARLLDGAVERLGEGLRRGRAFVWEAEVRDRRVECVPVGNGREVWWVCFAR